MAGYCDIPLMSGAYRWVSGVYSEGDCNWLWIDERASKRRQMFLLTFIFICSYIPMRIYGAYSGEEGAAWAWLGALLSVFVYAFSSSRSEESKRHDTLSRAILAVFIFHFIYCISNFSYSQTEIFSRLRFLASGVFLVMYWVAKFLEVASENWNKPYVAYYKYKESEAGFEECGKVYVLATGDEGPGIQYHSITKVDEVIRYRDLFKYDYILELQRERCLDEDDLAREINHNRTNKEIQGYI